MALAERVPGAYRPKIDVVWPALVDNHEVLAARLFELWELSAELETVIEHHQVRLEPGVNLTAVIVLADAVASEAGVYLTGEFQLERLELARRALGIDSLTLAELRHQAEVFASVED